MACAEGAAPRNLSYSNPKCWFLIADSVSLTPFVSLHLQYQSSLVTPRPSFSPPSSRNLLPPIVKFCSSLHSLSAHFVGKRTDRPLLLRHYREVRLSCQAPLLLQYETASPLRCQQRGGERGCAGRMFGTPGRRGRLLGSQVVASGWCRQVPSYCC